MTEAALKNKKNTKTASDNRISTHPSYKEYSWESLVNNNRPEAPTAMHSNANAGARRMNTAARKGAQVHAGAGRRTTDRVKTNAGTKARTGVKSGTNVRAKTTETVKAQVKKAEKIRKKSIVAIHTIVVEKKYSFPLSIVLIALCFTVLIMAIVTTSVQISEITAENSALERKYNSMVSEENELRLLLETRDDLRIVETMAKEDLGMVKKDQVDRYYLTVHKEDKIEIVEEEVDTGTNIFEEIMGLGGAFVERIRGFFGM